MNDRDEERKKAEEAARRRKLAEERLSRVGKVETYGRRDKDRDPPPEKR